MKALEHLLIQELTQIRALESRLYSTFDALKEASADQVTSFVDGLSDLDRRATRIERLLDNMGASEPLAA